MEDQQDNNLLTYVALAAVAFLAYRNWNTIGPMIGFPPTFNDEQSLIAYCQQNASNPTKQATLAMTADDGSPLGGTFSCVRWLKAYKKEPAAMPSMASSSDNKPYEPPKPFWPEGIPKLTDDIIQ